MNKLLILVLLSSNICYAQEAVYLDKGKPAPFSAYLVPELEVKQLRNDSLERDMYKTTNDLKDQQIKLLTDQNTSLANTIDKSEKLSTWEKIGWFAAGIVITGLAVDGASKIINK